MSLTKAQAAAEVMLHLCEHAAHGYSQPARKGDGTTERVRLSDGSIVHVHGGDYDCSEAVRQCWAAVGVLPTDSYMWTGNEHDLLTAHGFEELSFDKSSLRVGDVLWKSGHTELVVKPGYQAGFNGDERGGLGQGAKVGDQTGYESWVKPVRDYWTKVYRYVPQNGWQKMNDNGQYWLYYSDGQLVRRKWVKWHDAWYWLKKDGHMAAAEWVRYGGAWYWCQADGKMVESDWVQWMDADHDERWYWLKEGGKMAASECLLIRGRWYAFDRHGRMINDKITTNKNGSLVL